ncbi:hypothetical protein DICVIV_11711 [Dictyocaulus viviparus]|uniref:Phosphoribulokinase/uridine kinase domain-containing protein n=1 Tax=Dictyocaulus viviparus TaxID=29172 RepID=A0A0D8XF46_DICVI|nr:hypothetical protein DICVIV_11711 [Dictyocaulus viviparus]
MSFTNDVHCENDEKSNDLHPVGRVLGIAGCTNSGKTTMAEILTKMLIEENFTVRVIHQDEFFHAKEKVEKFCCNNKDQQGFFYNYDCKSAIDHEKLIYSIKTNTYYYNFVIVEGNMLTEWTDVIELCDRVIFLMLDQVLKEFSCKCRRALLVI